MKYEIAEETLGKILNYLIDKPYREVVNIIAELNNGIKPIIEKEETVMKAEEETIGQP